MLEKISVGIDVVEIKKFQEKVFKNNISFYEKLFNKNEIEYCLKFKDSYKHFAAKFAVKEALKKTIEESVEFLDIITDHDNNNPIVYLKRNKKYFFKTSLSHENSVAVAVVISEIIE